MKTKLSQIEDAAVNLLSSFGGIAINRNIIEEKVRAIAGIEDVDNEQDIQLIIRKLEERFDITMDLGTLFAADHYRPWLDSVKGDTDCYYWDRYKRFLIQNGRSPNVLRSLDSITDQILDHLENPNKEGNWARKGMVVGHVQSGKTENYTGIVNKAADSGYKVIIVLAGMLNSLRNQTQTRLDSGFIGLDTEKKQPTGVGLFSIGRSPAYFTTSISDFKKAVANQIGVRIKDLREPVILVIKKNKSTLTNLIDWLKHNNSHNLERYPMLLIDDEADHGSINTNKSGQDATAINKKIRQLLHLFDRSSYLGYTATPFANVFIDPETDNEMLGDDLFPSDFIISLDPPSNYVGSKRVFSSEADLKIVKEVEDYEDQLPIKHKKGFEPEDLPLSLKEAINVFILARTIRLLRGQENGHNSMLVNISRFTDVQSYLRLLIDEYLKVQRQAIINYSKLNESQALQNTEIANLKHIWSNEFSDLGFEWGMIQSKLKDAVSPINVVEVNSSTFAELLDYTEKNYPNGRNVIAIGGLSLSRGLTLEGLTVSYFLRNSTMYDTLMQMGRWFGYRDKYEDLCRIYMTAEASSWYGHISDATEELREEFRRMKAAGSSPKDFGLAIRSHPESLIVTARNKMRTGRSVTREINLEGRLVETAVLYNDPNCIARNLVSMKRMAEAAERTGTKSNSQLGHLWQNVPSIHILEFVEEFQNHPLSQLTERGPLKEYISWLKDNGKGEWDILLVNPQLDPTRSKVQIASYLITAQKRTINYTCSNGVILNKRRVASRGLEKAGLSQDEVERANSLKQSPNISDHTYRSVRRQPLLMLHLLDCQKEKEQWLLAAYGISFPGSAGSRRPKKLVEYIVNTTWWNNEYADLLEEDSDDLGVDYE